MVFKNKIVREPSLWIRCTPCGTFPYNCTLHLDSNPAWLHTVPQFKDCAWIITSLNPQYQFLSSLILPKCECALTVTALCMFAFQKVSVYCTGSAWRDLITVGGRCGAANTSVISPCSRWSNLGLWKWLWVGWRGGEVARTGSPMWLVRNVVFNKGCFHRL